MATYHAISTIGQAVLGLLRAARQPTEFPGARFELYQARNFKQPMDEGVSLFLYRVQASTARRQLPGRISTSGRHYRRPLPLDLFYMLNAWGRTAEMQHVLLGWAMRVIEDSPTLSAGVLNAVRPDTFHPDEAVDLVHDPLTLQELSNMWDLYQEGFDTMATYVARVVAIDSEIEVEEGPPVQARSVTMAVDRVAP